MNFQHFIKYFVFQASKHSVGITGHTVSIYGTQELKKLAVCPFHAWSNEHCTFSYCSLSPATLPIIAAPARGSRVCHNRHYHACMLSPLLDNCLLVCSVSITPARWVAQWHISCNSYNSSTKSELSFIRPSETAAEFWDKWKITRTCS